jgi:purine-nucleoside phosphorylase
MSAPSHFGEEVPGAAEFLRERLGSPELGVVLGSGFAPLAEALRVRTPVPASEIPGFPECTVAGHPGGVAATAALGAGVWVFSGRLHLHEGHDAARVALPLAILAAAGARRALLTCASGGLLESDRPGDFALVTDHLNLTGEDPLRSIPSGTRNPAFLDLQGAYDLTFLEGWRLLADSEGLRLRDGVLAAVPGPCYETPAEVRMLRALGADLVTMSTVPEAIAARYLGLRVAAVACIANVAAGTKGQAPIDHRDVLETVGGAVAERARALVGGIERMLRN